MFCTDRLQLTRTARNETTEAKSKASTFRDCQNYGFGWPGLRSCLAGSACSMLALWPEWLVLPVLCQWCLLRSGPCYSRTLRPYILWSPMIPEWVFYSCSFYTLAFCYISTLSCHKPAFSLLSRSPRVSSNSNKRYVAEDALEFLILQPPAPKLLSLQRFAIPPDLKVDIFF